MGKKKVAQKNIELINSVQSQTAQMHDTMHAVTESLDAFGAMTKLLVEANGTDAQLTAFQTLWNEAASHINLLHRQVRDHNVTVEGL